MALIFGVHALRSYLKLICEYEFHRLPNEKVSGAKDHGKNYIKVRPPLVRHLLRNRLSQCANYHGSQRCLGYPPIQRQDANSKKLMIEKLSKSSLRRSTKFDQAHSIDKRKVTLSLILHFILDFRI